MPNVQAVGGSARMGPQAWSGWPEADDGASFLSPTLMSANPLRWAISPSHHHYRLESHLVLFDSEKTPGTTASPLIREVREMPLAEVDGMHEQWWEAGF